MYCNQRKSLPLALPWLVKSLPFDIFHRLNRDDVLSLSESEDSARILNLAKGLAADVEDDAINCSGTNGLGLDDSNESADTCNLINDSPN